MYSEGAINSIVADLHSGRLSGSPQDFDTGSYRNSSGTEIKRIKNLKECSYRHFLAFWGYCFGDLNNIKKIPGTVKLGNKERFDKEQIGIKEPFPVTKFFS